MLVLRVVFPAFPRRGRFGAEQQRLPPPAQVQAVTCSPGRAPAAPPILSPSLMIPPAGCTPHQPSAPLQLHQWPQQQLQQHRLYLQVLEQAQGWVGVVFFEEMGLIWFCTSSIPVVSRCSAFPG